jgi:hypothetical protein
MGLLWMEIQWSDVRCAYRVASGIKLSPYSDPAHARTEQLRGVTLFFEESQRPEIENYVQDLAGHPTQSLPSGAGR